MMPQGAKDHLGYVLGHQGDHEVLPLMHNAVEARTEIAQSGQLAGNRWGTPSMKERARSWRERMARSVTECCGLPCDASAEQPCVAFLPMCSVSKPCCCRICYELSLAMGSNSMVEVDPEGDVCWRRDLVVALESVVRSAAGSGELHIEMTSISMMTLTGDCTGAGTCYTWTWRWRMWCARLLRGARGRPGRTRVRWSGRCCRTWCCRWATTRSSATA